METCLKSYTNTVQVKSKMFQVRDLLDEIPIGINFPAKLYRTVAMKKLMKKWWARQPHPRPCINWPIGIQQELFEYLNNSIQSIKYVY